MGLGAGGAAGAILCLLLLLPPPLPPVGAMGVRRGRVAPVLEGDVAAYFRRALETLQEGLSPEELDLFATNVLAEAVAAGPGVALDPSGSRVLEALLPRAPAAVLSRVLSPLVGGLGGPAGHPLGARVLEAALQRVPEVVGPPGDAVGPPGDAMGRLEDAVGRQAAVVRGEAVAFARHPNGSFVLRALLRALAGIQGAGPPHPPHRGAEPKPKGAEPAAKGVEPKPKGAELPPSFPLLLGQLAEVFEENLPSLVSPPCASLCLQGALEALRHSQSAACTRLCDALIGYLALPGHAPGESPLVAALQDAQRGRLVEAVLAAAGPQQLRDLFREHLQGHLVGVANHRLANHGLQRLLDHAPCDVVGAVLEELGPALQQPLARGHPGVLTALTGACRRHPPLQPQALRRVLEAFDCWEPPERRQGCVGPLAALRPWGVGDKEQGAEPEPTPGAVTLPGSLLLQHLLHFGDPGPVLGALAALPPAALAALALSPPGSHVWDALLASPSVPPRARRRLLRKLKGHFLSLACHRNGSRVLDAILASSSPRTRAAIAAELAPQRPALLRDPHGRGVERRLRLLLRRPRQWRLED
ncbi:nucleolar protein 9 isoform X2 [Cygnus atratus]|uniref:nucleolar protein 9 isoform X2 n=2 Tax=Cygnus atratus TaxID=8868 RepID=UPI0021B82F0F|nr:nucleolar protein 9 isoform X2 [Cygnus atratus]